MEPYKKIFGLRLSAVLETLVFLTVLLIGNFLFGDGNRFIDSALHPFWIVVLLVTVQYGTAEGLFAAAASTFFLYAYNVPYQLATETTFDYEVRLGFTPSLWFIAAFVLGELRMRLEWENQKLREDYLHAKTGIDKITEEYEVLKEMNQNLEVRLTSEEETVAASFAVFKALEALDPVQIIFGLDSIIELALHPKKFSVYAKGPNGLEAVTSEGWELNDAYCRRFVPSSPLYHAIAEEKKMISVINKEERGVLTTEGMLAAPLIDPDSGEVFGMVKVEVLEFKSLNLSRLETFRIACELIGRAYANAKKHHELKKDLKILGKA